MVYKFTMEHPKKKKTYGLLRGKLNFMRPPYAKRAEVLLGTIMIMQQDWGAHGVLEWENHGKPWEKPPLEAAARADGDYPWTKPWGSLQHPAGDTNRFLRVQLSICTIYETYTHTHYLYICIYIYTYTYEQWLLNPCWWLVISWGINSYPTNSHNGDCNIPRTGNPVA